MPVVFPAPLHHDAYSPSDETLTVSSVTLGSHGSVAINGTVTYTPDSNFIGSDSFTYSVEDTDGNTATGTVNVTVNPAIAITESPPAAISDTTIENTALTVPVMDQSTDVQLETLTVTAVTQGADGTVTLSDGVITYTPNTDFTGTDTFIYTVEDTDGNTASGFVTVTVVPAMTAVAAGNATVSTAENTAVTVSVLSDTVSPMGGTTTVSSVTQGADGSVVINDNGTVTYTPTTGFVGMDTFTYTASNSTAPLVTSTGTITVMVGAFDMVALGAFVTTTPGTANTVNVLSSCDTLVMPGTTVSLASVTQGAHGSVTMNDNGTVTYSPDEGFCGTDTFTYTAEDENGALSTGTVTEFVSANVSPAPPNQNQLQQVQVIINLPNPIATAWQLRDQILTAYSKGTAILKLRQYLTDMLTSAQGGNGPFAGNMTAITTMQNYIAYLNTSYKKTWEVWVIAGFKFVNVRSSFSTVLPPVLKGFDVPDLPNP